MQRTTAAGKLALAVWVMITSPLSLAEESGWYGGLNLGQSRAKIDDVRITSGLLAGRFATTSISNYDRDTGYKFFAGYRVNRNFALEGGYFDLGKFGFSANTVPLGTLTGNIKVKGLNLDLVGILPVTEKFSAFGRVGVNGAQARDVFTGTGLVAVVNTGPSKRDTNVKYGAGFQYAFNDSVAMRAEVERYRIDDAVGNKGDIDLVSVGVVYRFGAKAPAPASRAMMPEPVTPIAHTLVPEPAVATPAPRPAAVPQPPRKVTFSADSLFDFDKSVVKPAGKQALDKFATDLGGTNFAVIAVTGYTDRIGSQAYNMALSMRRAEAVKAYLVIPAGLPASKISATGAGESSPVTKPLECVGKRASPQLISCLQPDRRVEVEVSGTQ